MYIKSLYPWPPPVPDVNVHYCMFGSESDALAPDYTLHIDALTGKKRSYYEFRERVRDAATALAAPPSEGGLGVSAEGGDIVGIFSHNAMDYITLVQALLVIATPISLLSAFATPFELAHALRTSKVTSFFVEPRLLGTALAAAKEVGIPPSHIFILEGRQDGHRSLQDLLDGIKKRGTSRVAVKPATRNTLAYLVFSSGTSGLPKAVMISHGNLWATLQANAVAKRSEEEFLGATPLDFVLVNLSVLPFYHTYGVHMACFRNFSIPTTYVIVSRWDAELVLRAIAKYAINVLLLVPSMIHQLANHTLTGQIDLSSVYHIHSGAAYLPPALASKMKTYVKEVPQVYEGYGMSEQTLSSIRKPVPGIFGMQPKVGSAGILLPGQEARIVREDGSEADVGEPGELWIRGANVALGYFGNEKATRETFVDGWLRTGDTFKADADGTFYFVDRAKDTLKVSGAQVSPTEIEDVLRAHPDKLIADVSVAGVSGGRTSDEKIPRAWLVLSDAGKRTGQQEVLKVLDGWAKQNLSKYKWLRGGYQFVDQIPKSPTGKVLRRVLTDSYEQQFAQRSKL